jgi:hypothetical protein
MLPKAAGGGAMGVLNSGELSKAWLWIGAVAARLLRLAMSEAKIRRRYIARLLDACSSAFEQPLKANCWLILAIIFLHRDV